MLFTIMLEYEGTTSVSQVPGRSVDEAYRGWFRGLQDPGRYGLDPQQAKGLAAALSFDCIQSPTPLASTKNVWSISARVDENLALLNFIATLAGTSKPAAGITAVTTPNQQVARKHPKAVTSKSREKANEAQPGARMEIGG